MAGGFTKAQRESFKMPDFERAESLDPEFKKSQEKRRKGRPRAIIDWDLVQNMMQIQCTKNEIAHCLEVAPDTLLVAIKEKFNCTYSELFRVWGDAGKMSLRRAQFKCATQSLNPTMLIHLDQKYLSDETSEPRNTTYESPEWLE